MMNIEEFISDHQRLHSELQMDHFITTRSGYGHPYGMYRQCLRELVSRRDRLQALDYEIEDVSIELDALERKRRWSFWRTRIGKRRIELAYNRKHVEWVGLQKKRPDVERELQAFLRQAREIKPAIGELTVERREEWDHSFWMHKLRCDAAISLFARGRLTPEWVEVVASLEPQDREYLWRSVSQPKELVEWLKTGADVKHLLSEEGRPKGTSHGSLALEVLKHQARLNDQIQRQMAINTEEFLKP